MECLGSAYRDVCWRGESKQEWNDDPLISRGATSALVEQTASKKAPRLTFLEHSYGIHQTLLTPPYTRPLLCPRLPLRFHERSRKSGTEMSRMSAVSLKGEGGCLCVRTHYKNVPAPN